MITVMWSRMPSARRLAAARPLLLVITLGCVLVPVRCAAACTDDLSCSLNGECVGGVCSCDSGWVGSACERLDLLPADLSQGYNRLLEHEQDNESTSSWGATQLKGDDGVYHTFVGEMVGHCGINGYETNEQIVHATSTHVLGPWQRQGPVKPFGSSAVCPHAVRSPDGKWLIFHTGCGNHSDPNSEGFGTNKSLPITNCVNGSTPRNPEYGPSNSRQGMRHDTNANANARVATCGVASDITSVFVSDSPFGPWTQQRLKTKTARAKLINGVAWPGCVSHLDPELCEVPDFLGGNPTALILENGTTVILFRTYHSNITQCEHLGAVVRNSSCVGAAGCPNGYPGCTVIALAVASAWDAEYEIKGGPQVPFQQEDPYIYKTARGFHAVYHGMDPWPSHHTGRHSYSLDGITWHGGDVDCWNNTLELTDGSTIELARRERPELVHEDGQPVALINGAQFGAVPGNPGDQTFTLVQAVRHS